MFHNLRESHDLSFLFLDLCELMSQDADYIENTLLKTLKINGFHEEYLKKKLYCDCHRRSQCNDRKTFWRDHPTS